MLKGSMPALVTPFDHGKLDLKTLENLVDWHIEQGSHGLVPVGTTGESPTLSHEEHEIVVSTVVKKVNGRIPVIAGAGSNNTLEALHFMKHAKTVGADAALIVTPYYNKPTQTGLIQHFTELHDNCDLPIIIYNIPGRSSIDMNPETMGHLSKLPRIIGVKDATGDLARVCAQRISVTANVAPKLSAQLQAATLAGDYTKALELQDKLMPLHHAIFTEPGLVGAKYAMSLLGLCSDEVRLPLTPVSEKTKTLIKSAIQFAGLT